MDRPLCGKGKSSLVGIWGHLLFLNMEGKKKLTTFPNILNNLAWIVLIVLKIKVLMQLTRSCLKNFPTKVKETAHGSNRSLKFSLRFSQNKLTKWHAFVMNNERTHPHMVLRQGKRCILTHVQTVPPYTDTPAEPSPGQGIDWLKGEP